MSDEPIRAFPCAWPAGWPKQGGYKSTAFRSRGQPVTVYDGVQRVLYELSRLGVAKDDVVISTNIPTRLDGLPRSDRGAAGGPEVAVYWVGAGGKRQVMAIDLYASTAGNLAAVAATLEAMRAIERHGGAQIMERAFTGFTALPAPDSWREILLEPKDLAEARRTYRQLASSLHPDKGGSEHAMARLNAAWAKAQEELA